MRSLQLLMAVDPTRKCNLENLNLLVLTSLKSSPGGQLVSLDSGLIDEKNLIDCDLSEEICASIQKTLDGKCFNNCIFKDPLSGMRQFLTTESPLKMMKNYFYFILEAPFVLKIFTVLS